MFWTVIGCGIFVAFMTSFTGPNEFSIARFLIGFAVFMAIIGTIFMWGESRKNK